MAATRALEGCGGGVREAGRGGEARVVSVAMAHVREPSRVLHERGNRESAGASSRRVHRDEDVVDVIRRLAQVVNDLLRNALDHCLDVGLMKGFLRSICRYTQRFAQQHGLRAAKRVLTFQGRVLRKACKIRAPDLPQAGLAQSRPFWTTASVACWQVYDGISPGGRSSSNRRTPA